jgi:S1-C subfamily serine protease
MEGLSIDAQWNAIAACPKISVPTGVAGTGALIGIREDFAYVLTAAHVAKFDGVELEFTNRLGYPKPSWFAANPTVVKRWPQPDLALIRFSMPKNKTLLTPLKLAGIGDRTRVFPTGGWSVGVGSSAASTVSLDAIVQKKAVRRTEGMTFFWETVEVPEAGRSGGPLIDAKGQVIGICSASSGGRGYYTHLDEIQVVLKRDGFGWLIGRQ